MAGARAKSPASRPATSKIPNVAEVPAAAAKVCRHSAALSLSFDKLSTVSLRSLQREPREIQARKNSSLTFLAHGRLRRQ